MTWPRATRVGHVGLQVPDLQRSVTFAQDILGLRLVERRGSTAYLTCNARHHELVLVEGDQAGLDHLAFEVADASVLAQYRELLPEAGFELVQREVEIGVEDALSFTAPGGFVVELFCGMAQNQPVHYDTIGARPVKFEHMTIKASDKPAMEAFLIDVLGLRVSDRAEDAISWLRVSSEHHGVSVVAADEDALNHYAFQVDGWASIGRTGDHLMHHGRGFLWGPGHHGIGDNYFCYFLDDDGAIVEYSANILHVEDEARYEPRVWPDEPLTVNRWGNPPPPAQFVDGAHPLVVPVDQGVVP